MSADARTPTVELTADQLGDMLVETIRGALSDPRAAELDLERSQVRGLLALLQEHGLWSFERVLGAHVEQLEAEMAELQAGRS